MTAETEQRLRILTLRAHSRVHQVCHVIVGFHVLRVDVTLDLGFHVVIGVGRLTIQQESFIRQLHFTTQTQHQVQSSFLLDVVGRLCPVIVNLICIPNSFIFHIAKTGLLRCCLCRSRSQDWFPSLNPALHNDLPLLNRTWPPWLAWSAHNTLIASSLRLCSFVMHYYHVAWYCFQALTNCSELSRGCTT